MHGLNSLKTAMLLGLLSAIFVVGGGAIAGQNGLMLGLVMAVGMNFFSYFFSDKMALASYSAQPLTAESNPEIYARLAPIVQRLAEKMKLPMPKLWLLPEDQPNAFATGRNPAHASVAVTKGILRLMNDRELEGVLAHELGHVLHRDILISSVAATLAAAISYLGYFGRFMGGGGDRGFGEGNDDRRGSGILMIFLAPLAAALIQMAISRSREYDADAASAACLGTPDNLISGLRKLELGVQRVPMDDASTSTAHLFILNPFRGGGMARWFSTHPSTEDRIARLEALRGQVVRQ